MFDNNEHEFLINAIVDGNLTNVRLHFGSVKTTPELLNQKIAEDGSTALHFAAYYNQLDIIKYLIENGADVNITDSKGQTPFDLAASQNLPEVTEYLLLQGASIKKESEGKPTIPPKPVLDQKYQRINAKLRAQSEAEAVARREAKGKDEAYTPPAEDARKAPPLPPKPARTAQPKPAVDENTPLLGGMEEEAIPRPAPATALPGLLNKTWTVTKTVIGVLWNGIKKTITAVAKLLGIVKQEEQPKPRVVIGDAKWRNVQKESEDKMLAGAREARDKAKIKADTSQQSAADQGKSKGKPSLKELKAQLDATMLMLDEAKVVKEEDDEITGLATPAPSVRATAPNAMSTPKPVDPMEESDRKLEEKFQEIENQLKWELRKHYEPQLHHLFATGLANIRDYDAFTKEIKDILRELQKSDLTFTPKNDEKSREIYEFIRKHDEDLANATLIAPGGIAEGSLHHHEAPPTSWTEIKETNPDFMSKDKREQALHDALQESYDDLHDFYEQVHAIQEKYDDTTVERITELAKLFASEAGYIDKIEHYYQSLMKMDVIRRGFYNVLDDNTTFKNLANFIINYNYRLHSLETVNADAAITQEEKDNSHKLARYFIDLRMQVYASLLSDETAKSKDKINTQTIQKIADDVMALHNKAKMIEPKQYKQIPAVLREAIAYLKHTHGLEFWEATASNTPKDKPVAGPPTGDTHSKHITPRDSDEDQD